MSARGWEEGRVEMPANGVWGDENALELGCGDSCTTLWMYENHQIIHLSVNYVFINLLLKMSLHK